MKKCFFILMLFFSANATQAQKIVKKTILSSNIFLVQIDVNNCFELLVENSDSDEFIVEAIIDGEYKKDLLLKVTEEGTTVKVSAGFQPIFINPNDKLSAHKVVSIALKIKVPKYKKIAVTGKSCNVTITGEHDNVTVVLNDGRCTLTGDEFTGAVKTQSGDINCVTTSDKATAISTYGEVFGNNVFSKSELLTLSTTTGNIYLKKTE